MPSKKTVKTRKPAAARKPAATETTAGPKPAASTATAKASPRKSAESKPAAATKPDTREITFTYFAPKATTVCVAGDFTQWEASPITLVKDESGMWKTTVALKPGRYQYRLLVNGQWQNDPNCTELEPNAFGTVNCVLSVAA